MRHTFHRSTEDNREHRLIRNIPGPEFSPGPGLPSYEQLAYRNQQLEKKVQMYDRLALEGQLTPREAQQQVAKQQLNAQQRAWKSMQFAFGASPPAFYPNIGTRARYWRGQQPQYQQYNQFVGLTAAPQQQQKQKINTQNAPQTPPAPQPEYLTGLGRNPDAPVAPPQAPPAAPQQRFRIVPPREPRPATPDIPYTGPLAEYDDQGNMVIYRPVPGQMMQNQPRSGEQQNVLSVRREEIRKVLGVLRILSQLLSPQERKVFEVMINTFEQLVTAAERMETAANQGNLKVAQQHAQDVQTRLRGLWVILPQGLQKMLGQVLQKEGLLSGTEPLGQFQLAWSIDANFTTPTIQVQPRTGGAAGGGGGVNYTSTGPGAKQQYEKNAKNLPDAQAKRKQEGGKNLDARTKERGERIKQVQEQARKLTEQTGNLQKRREGWRRDMDSIVKQQNALDADIASATAALEKITNAMASTSKQIDAARKEHQDFIAKSEAQIKGWEEQLDKASGLALMQTLLGNMKKLQAEMKTRNEQQDKLLAPLLASREAAAKQLGDINTRIETMRKQSEPLNQQRKKFAGQISGAEKDLNDIQEQLKKIQATLKSI